MIKDKLNHVYSVLKQLKQRGKKLTLDNIAERIGMSHEGTRFYVLKLAKQHKVKKDKKGRIIDVKMSDK